MISRWRLVGSTHSGKRPWLETLRMTLTLATGSWLQHDPVTYCTVLQRKKHPIPYTGVDSHSYFSVDASKLSGRSERSPELRGSIDPCLPKWTSGIQQQSGYRSLSQTILAGPKSCAAPRPCSVHFFAGIASSSSVLDLILLSCAMRIYLRTGSWKPFNHICHLCVILCDHKRVRP